MEPPKQLEYFDTVRFIQEYKKQLIKYEGQGTPRGTLISNALFVRFRELDTYLDQNPSVDCNGYDCPELIRSALETVIAPEWIDMVYEELKL